MDGNSCKIFGILFGRMLILVNIWSCVFKFKNEQRFLVHFVWSLTFMILNIHDFSITLFWPLFVSVLVCQIYRFLNKSYFMTQKRNNFANCPGQLARKIIFFDKFFFIFFNFLHFWSFLISYLFLKKFILKPMLVEKNCFKMFFPFFNLYGCCSNF